MPPISAALCTLLRLTLAPDPAQRPTTEILLDIIAAHRSRAYQPHMHAHTSSAQPGGRVGTDGGAIVLAHAHAPVAATALPPVLAPAPLPAPAATAMRTLPLPAAAMAAAITATTVGVIPVANAVAEAASLGVLVSPEAPNASALGLRVRVSSRG